MTTKSTPKEIDDKKFQASIDLVRAGSYLRRLLKERSLTDPELKEATILYEKARRRFHRMQRT